MHDFRDEVPSQLFLTVLSKSEIGNPPPSLIVPPHIIPQWGGPGGFITDVSSMRNVRIDSPSPSPMMLFPHMFAPPAVIHHMRVLKALDSCSVFPASSFYVRQPKQPPHHTR